MSKVDELRSSQNKKEQVQEPEHKAGDVLVLNNTMHKRTIDLGAPNREQDGVREVIKIPSGTFSKEENRVLPGKAYISADHAKRLREHKIGASLISKGILQLN